MRLQEIRFILEQDFANLVELEKYIKYASDEEGVEAMRKMMKEAIIE